MRSPLPLVLILLGSMLLAVPAIAAEPGPGKTVTVTCKSATDQRYACYLPAKYTRDKTWPILYCFSPNGNGDAFVQRYRKVCEERGWIVVGSMNSRNGPWEPIQKAIDAMWADTQKRFNLSKTMRYASGFSGGARVSFALAEMKPENVSGVIAIGAGLHSSAKAPKKTLACFLMCGETDPNKRELDPLSKRLEEAGNPVHYENFTGGHVMPQVDLMEKAVRWIDDQAAERKAQRLAAAIGEAQRLIGEEELVEAWRLLSTTLETLPSVKEGRAAAEKLLKELSRKPAVKPEIQAQKELVKSEAFLTKYAERIRKFEAKRDEARKKLKRIVDRWPESLAADAARKHLEALDAMESD